MPRFGTKRSGIFELGKNKLIGRSLDLAYRLGEMTLLVLVFSLFLLFPFSTNAKICFLPDCHLNDFSVSMDADRCEDEGYVYYASGVCPDNYTQDTCIFNPNYLKCNGDDWCKDNGYTLTSCASPKTLSTPCPSNGLFYKYCVCPSEYKYTCSGTGYNGGSGTACDSKYTKCNCSTNYTWSGSACVCSSDFKYSCSGTGYSSGSGTACGGNYKSCNCSTYYSWNGSACTHTHSYVCPSGYQESNTGMTNPTSTSKVCALSGCSSTSGECYAEGHSHSYSCPSGYRSSCSKGYSGTTSKTCSCGATSGICYECCSTSYKHTCTGAGYSGGNGAACGGYYQKCTCSSGYIWQSGDCVACDSSCKVGSIFYSDGTCNTCVIDGKTPIGVVIKNDSLVISEMSFPTKRWAGSDTIDVADVTNYTSCADAITDYNGKANTLAIVAAYPSDTTSNNAAIYCNSYSTAGTNAGDWYLPAAGEVYNYVVPNSQAIWNTTGYLDWEFTSNYFWSSSEKSASNAWAMLGGQSVGSNCNGNHSKYKNVAVVFCFLDISDL